MADLPELHTHEPSGPPAGSKVVAMAIDGSGHSMHALDFYIANLWTPNDYVVIITVPEVERKLGDALYAFDSKNLSILLEEQKSQVNKNLASARDKLLAKNIRGKVRAVFSSMPGETICRVAQEEKAVFIVMGSRGHGMFRRTVTGSVSNYVMQHSKMPVMVCRNRD